jgi:flavin reductase (DIM6/NTAB) family NADH-FMN oxidoreductase RutF
MVFDYSDKTLSQRYRLMSQTIIPRPIAWVVTEAEGVVNIAPFSYFIGLSSDPATLLISVGHKKDGRPKDTLRNLRATKKCTICMLDRTFLEMMHFSSKELEEGISEAELFGIPTKKVHADFPPVVEGVPAAFFCELYQEIDLKGSKTVPLVVQIKQQFVDERCILNEEKLSISYQPVARIGRHYALLGEEIEPPEFPS